MRARVVGPLLLAVLLVPACGELPTDGTVRSPESVAAAPTEGRVVFLPPPPTEGATPEEVVEGFLLAQGGDDPDHGVARQYLTRRAASTWDDEAGVVTFVAEPDLEEVDVPTSGTELSLDVTVSAVGRIDPEGSYQPVDESVQASFALVRVDGEWRLNEVPDGLWLSARTARLVLTRVLPHFLAPLEPHVVPDPRFLPQQEGLPDRLVELVLAGPSDRLAPFVGTAAEGVRLRGPVEVDGDGTAVVDLVGLDGADTARREALAAQLGWTLLASEGIEAVRVLDEGEDLVLDGSDEPLEVTSPLLEETDPDVLLTDGDLELVAVQGASLRVFRGRGADNQVDVRLSEPVRYPALPLEGEEVAALAGDVTDARTASRLVLTSLDGGPVETLVEAPSLSRPVFDPLTNEIWTVRSSGPSATGSQAVLMVDPDGGEVRQLDAEALLDLGTVLLLRPSRDGSRVAALVQTPADDAGATSVRVVVAHVDRGGGAAEGYRPRAVVRVRDLTTSEIGAPTGATDLAWAGADRLAVLVSTGARVPAQPVLVPVEGSDTLELPADGPLPGLRVSLAAANGDASGAELVVEVDSAAGRVLYRGRGDVYSQLGPGRDPTFRG